MKKALFLLLAGLSAVGTALAGPPSPAANVNFASERGVPFAVVLDGRPLTGRGLVRQVHAERLLPGLHYADFSVPSPYGGIVRLRSRVWLEPGLETTFVLLARPGRPLDLRQAGAVALYYPGRGGYGGRYDEGRGRGIGGYDNGRYNNGNAYPNGQAYPADPYGPRPGPPDPNYSQNGNDTYGQPGGYPQNPNDGGYNQPAPGASGYPDSYQPLAARDVDGLAQALSRSSFDDERLRIAKQALSQNSLYADDLSRLLKNFQYDEARVNFAEFAYPHVADRQNFYRVYPSFDFSANARRVQDAVGAMSEQEAPRRN